MRAFVLGLFLVLLQGAAFAADPGLLTRVNVFVADDRVEIAQSRQTEYSAVGYLDVPVPPSMCIREGSAQHYEGGCAKGGTAFLVGPRHILTSAHLAFAANPHDMGPHRKSTFWAVRHAMARATPVAWGNYTPTEYRDSEDWALLELDRPLGLRYGWFGLRAVDERTAARDGFRVMSLGFPQDAQRGSVRRLMLDPDCRILSSPLLWSAWSTDCATRRGASGGPVFYRDGESVYVIAILAGSRGETEGVVARWNGARTNVAVPVAAVLPRISSIIGSLPEGGREGSRPAHERYDKERL
jgi:hypothetical protein